MTAATAPLAAASRLDPGAAGLLTLLCAAWGLNQVAIKVANAGFAPVFQAGLRSLLGAGIVLAWVMLRGIRLHERDGTLLPGLVAGALFGVEFLLIFVALDYTTVSRAILFIYTMPFLVALGAHLLLPGERLTRLRLAGLALAFLGVVLVFTDGLSLPSRTALIGDALCLAAAALWAATTLVIKATALRHARAEKTLLYQLGVSAALLLPLSPAFGPLLRESDLLSTAAFAYQVVLVAGVSYVAWFWMVRRYPASTLSAFTFLTPVFGVAFGGLLLDEPLSARLLVSLVLIAIGIALVNRPADAGTGHKLRRHAP